MFEPGQLGTSLTNNQWLVGPKESPKLHTVIMASLSLHSSNSQASTSPLSVTLLTASTMQETATPPYKLEHAAVDTARAMLTQLAEKLTAVHVMLCTARAQSDRQEVIGSSRAYGSIVKRIELLENRALEIQEVMKHVAVTIVMVEDLEERERIFEKQVE